MKKLPDRVTLRLREYDYKSNGVYFVTVCTDDRQSILCDILPQTDMFSSVPTRLTKIGETVDQAIRYIDQMNDGVSVLDSIIMPNHIHLLIMIDHDNGCELSLSTIIGRLKSFTTKRAGRKIWQRSFHDHILRDGEELQRYYTYLSDNPALWALDKYYTEECA